MHNHSPYPTSKTPKVEYYPNFTSLSQNEKEGFDYQITTRIGKSGIIILAPHGGGIEPGTSEIAYAIAAHDHTFYTFKGLKRRDNQKLHLTSNNFDEPTALDLLTHSHRAITVHGCDYAHQQVLIGGLDKNLVQETIKVLRDINITSMLVKRGYLSGQSKQNLCNRTKSGKGLQLELPVGLRREMFQGWDRAGRAQTKPLFHQFTSAIRKIITLST